MRRADISPSARPGLSEPCKPLRNTKGEFLLGLPFLLSGFYFPSVAITLMLTYYRVTTHITITPTIIIQVIMFT